MDVDAAVALVRAESGYPDAQEWADYFIRAEASDAEAVATLSTRERRAA
ncbi:hypothetical protein [Arthrobacter livingstonensis]|nr:hypothetical protein [Arthrobacter livingstonensis]